MTDPYRESLANLTPMSLEEVVGEAALQTRVDRKYVITHERLRSVIDGLGDSLGVLQLEGERRFGYRSTYFDTPELSFYRQAALGRPVRFKVRTRIYRSSGTCWLEVKERRRGGETAKARIAYRPDDEHRLAADGREFVGSYRELAPVVGTLVPTLETLYGRSTLVVSGECSERLARQRVTIDTDLKWNHPDGEPIASMTRWAIVETKSATSHPGAFDRALWAVGARPLSMSKYALGIALSDRSLAANRWHRVLDRYFDESSLDGSSSNDSRKELAS